MAANLIVASAAASRLRSGRRNAPAMVRERLISLDAKEQKIVKVFLASLIGLGLGAGTFLLSRHLIRKARDKNISNASFGESSPENIAYRIRSAFDNDMIFGLGTDTESLREAILMVENKVQWEQVVAAYRKRFRSNLGDDLRDELKSSEYKEINAILAALPTSGSVSSHGPVSSARLSAWTTRLRAAFDYSTWGMFGGTDYPAVKQVLIEIPNRAALQALEAHFKSSTGRDLYQELSSELSLSELYEAQQIINQKQ